MTVGLEIWPFLSLGFLIGMAHALEADHLAAIATMANGKISRRKLIVRGAYWGLGHTASLFVICAAVVALGLTITGRAEAAMELAVGIMIVALGCRVFWRLHRERTHLHVHEHHGQQHIHLHSHAEDLAPHNASSHNHEHKRAQMITFGIGLMHGAAGSAGLLVLTAAGADTLIQALIYVAVFGMGSIAGMAALSAIASYPLGIVERGAKWMKTAAALGIGGLAVWVGGSLAVHSLAGL